MTALPDPDDAALEASLRASTVLLEAPESLVQRAIAAFQTESRAAARATTAVASPPAAPASLLQRLIARVSFDSSLAPLAATRSSAAATRQLLFSADGRDIELRISPGDGTGRERFQIAGQVLGPDTAGSAELVHPSYIATCRWNELAEFRFEDVPAGRLTLTLRTEQWVLELPAIDLNH